MTVAEYGRATIPTIPASSTPPTTSKRGEQQHLVSVSVKTGIVNSPAVLASEAAPAAVGGGSAWLGACFAGKAVTCQPPLPSKAVMVERAQESAVAVGRLAVAGGGMLALCLAAVLIWRGLKGVFEHESPGLRIHNPGGNGENASSAPALLENQLIECPFKQCADGEVLCCGVWAGNCNAGTSKAGSK